MRRPLFSLLTLLALGAACSTDEGSQLDTDDAGGTDTSDGVDESGDAPSSTSGAETSDPDDGSGDESSGGEDTDDGGSDTDGEPACSAVGFDAAEVWTLPDMSALPLSASDAMEQVGTTWSCDNEEQFRYTTMDLTGDGRVDLLVTDGCDGDGVGSERWIVHPGEDGGFGSPMNWALPDVSALPLSASDAMEQVGTTWSCDNEEQFRYTTMDLTGDGRLDFVISDGCDGAGVGSERWIVHPGEDGGFGSAMNWPLPDISALPLSASDAMEQVGTTWSCDNEEQFRYTTMDLTGDGQVDFVITDGCDGDGVGSERWIVHPGEDGGFGSPMNWALPDVSALPLSASDAMEQVGTTWSCDNEEQFRYTTMDLTGDGRLDFVITDGCDGAGVGSERWIVHPGEDGGFGSAMNWPLPDISALPLSASDAMEQVGTTWSCDNEEQFRYTTMDLTGDGQVDFVITDGCDGDGVGTERWIVHPGEDGGFGSATNWPLPDISALPLSASDPMEQVGTTWSCDNEEQFRYGMSELNGDGLPDLLITDGCDADGVGAERWILHVGACE